MSRFALPLLVSLALAAPGVLLGGESAAPPARPTIAKKVWTSEDVEALRAKGLISLIGQPPAAETPSGDLPGAPMAVAYTPHPVRAQDPKWYSEQLADFRTALETSDAEIRLVRREVANARYWEAGINLAMENTGITPDSGLEILDGRNHLVLARIDALGEQARRNHIPPAALR